MRHWLINASVGTTAAGNWLYNRATGMVGLLKRVSASLGMVAAAGLAVLRNRSVRGNAKKVPDPLAVIKLPAFYVTRLNSALMPASRHCP